MKTLIPLTLHQGYIYDTHIFDGIHQDLTPSSSLNDWSKLCIPRPDFKPELMEEVFDEIARNTMGL